MLTRGISYVFVGVLLVAGLWTPSAHAYIDAGTASMIFQMLIAGGLAAVLTMKSFWERLKGFVASLSRKSPPIDEKS